MKKEQFKKLKKQLLDRGYKLFENCMDNEDYNLCKAFHKEDNLLDKDRSGYQLIIKVYDYSVKDWPNLPDEVREYVGLEPVIMVSRTLNERMDLIVNWHDKDTIEHFEDMAESFYQWVCNKYPESKENYKAF